MTFWRQFAKQYVVGFSTKLKNAKGYDQLNNIVNRRNVTVLDLTDSVLP